MFDLQKLYQTVWVGINQLFFKKGLNFLKASCLILVLGVFLGSCVLREPGFYSLKDPEIFRSPSSHQVHVVVVRLRDRRPRNEIRWQEGIYAPGEDMVGRIGKRMADHLGEAGIFNKVEYSNKKVSTGNPDPAGYLKSSSVLPSGREVFLLSGDLSHFFGKTDLEGNIEGVAGLENLRLSRIFSGEVVWEGSFLKELKRKEKTTKRPPYYASEALRGVLNKLSLSLSLEKLALGGFGG